MTPKIDTVAIYAARNHHPDPRRGAAFARADQCAGQDCMAALCTGRPSCTTACAVLGGGPEGPARDVIRYLHRGRGLAPRPRSFAEIARDCYGAGLTDEGQLIQTSGRGGRP